MKILTSLFAVGALGIALSTSISAAEPSAVVKEVEKILVKHDGKELVPFDIAVEGAESPQYFILYFSASW
jgi:hypothetical protein